MMMWCFYTETLCFLNIISLVCFYSFHFPAQQFIFFVLLFVLFSLVLLVLLLFVCSALFYFFFFFLLLFIIFVAIVFVVVVVAVVLCFVLFLSYCCCCCCCGFWLQLMLDSKEEAFRTFPHFSITFAIFPEAGFQYIQRSYLKKVFKYFEITYLPCEWFHFTRFVISFK